MISHREVFSFTGFEMKMNMMKSENSFAYAPVHCDAAGSSIMFIAAIIIIAIIINSIIIITPPGTA